MKWSECEAKLKSFLREECSDHLALYESQEISKDFLFSCLADEIAWFIHTEFGLEKD